MNKPTPSLKSESQKHTFANEEPILLCNLRVAAMFRPPMGKVCPLVHKPFAVWTGRAEDPCSEDFQQVFASLEAASILHDPIAIGDFNVSVVHPVDLSYCISCCQDARPTIMRNESVDLAMKVFHGGRVTTFRALFQAPPANAIMNFRWPGCFFNNSPVFHP